MDSLPTELLIQIASYLDVQPSSITKFAHEPSTQLTCSDDVALKSLSRVCWRWRRVVLPILFRYSRIELDNNPQWVPVDARLIENMQSQLTDLSDHELQIYQRMRSKFKSNSSFAFDEAFDDLLINLCRVQKGDSFLRSVPHILWLPHLPGTFVGFERFVQHHNLKNHIMSLVVFTDKELRHVAAADAPLSGAVADIWAHIFSHLEPSRVVVAAPPATLAALLDVQVLSPDSWAFDMKMHYIELLQPEASPIEDASPDCHPADSILIHRRSWSHLGYNEGSSIAAYSTYEYHLKQSPKMLYLILARLAKDVDARCNIRSFSFTGIFPFSTNLKANLFGLRKITTLQKLQIRLAPGPESNLLDDPQRMGRAQPGDLALEFNDSYKVIARLLEFSVFESLMEFESWDCQEAARASEVEDYLNKQPVRESGWRQTDVGTWSRHHRDDKGTETVS